MYNKLITTKFSTYKIFKMNASNQHDEAMKNETKTSDMELNATRLTCAYNPMDYEENPEFDFDSLIVDTQYPEVTRSRCDDSQTEYMTCHNCGFVECEYYGYRYKSSTYCNKCAFEVCGKLIEKPKFAFTQLRIDIEEEEGDPEYFNCESCSNETKWEEKINYHDENGPWFCPKCAYDSDLRAPYSMDQCIALTMYAEKHNITFEEAIYYQTHCHSCGKYIEDAQFDEENHQYCNKRCFEHCEDYWYHCHQEADCKVCGIWEYHARRDSMTAYDIELGRIEPVLSTIDCFKELKVYNQFYECLGDLTEYFGESVLYPYE